MKAVISARYGSPDVLWIEQVPKPVPKAGELLIKVHATTVSRTDCGTLRAHPAVIGRLMTGFLRPKYKILGLDFAGEIESIGEGVTCFKPGERVFGMSPENYGAHAEYLCVPAKSPVATLPAGLDFNQAVVCEGAWYADTYLKKFGPLRGRKLLIYGASGAIGTAAVQLAKSYGAKVTAVVSTPHLELIESLGADHVVDYTTQDYTTIGETFDFVFDAVGKTTFFRCRQLLKSTGIYSAADLGPWWQNAMLAVWSSISGSNRVVFPTPKNGTAIVNQLKNLIEAGEFRAVIDREYELDEIVQAYQFVETTRKAGIVVIRVVVADEARNVKPSK